MDRPTKLELSRWSDSDRRFVEDLRAVLSRGAIDDLPHHVALALAAPSGVYDDWYLSDPSVYSLLRYGSPGVSALHELAEGKERLVAVRTLLDAAVGNEKNVVGRLWFTQAYLDDSDFARLVNDVTETVNNAELRREARRLLFAVVQNAVHKDDTFFFLSAFMDSEGQSLILELGRDAKLQLHDGICGDLERLISKGLPEKAFQEFLEAHPTVLDPGASEVVPRQNLGELWKTDFVVRRLDDRYIFVEIEKPQDRLFTRYPQPSTALSHAVGQVLSWFTSVEDNISYAHAHGFPGIHAPQGIVVIGRKKDMNAEQLRMLRTLNDILAPRVEVLTYDDVLDNARNIVRNLTARRQIGEKPL
jgi:hypothetical protein